MFLCMLQIIYIYRTDPMRLSVHTTKSIGKTPLNQLSKYRMRPSLALLYNRKKIADFKVSEISLINGILGSTQLRFISRLTS